MQKLRVESFSVSIDGFGAGPNQSPDNPLGMRGEDLHQWFLPTKTFQDMGKGGGTTFYFVTDGIQAALDRAFDAARDKDVRLGGGVDAIQQYLNAKLIDEMHIAISPVLLGSGESLFSGIDLVSLGYECADYVTTENATHVVIKKTDI